GAAPRAIVYHAAVAPRVARVLPHLAEPPLLLQVQDDSGEALLPGAREYERALAESRDTPVPVRANDDDLYMVYTGGTTGMPKGVLWRQRDIFFAALGGKLLGQEPVATEEAAVARAQSGELIRL